MKLYYSLLFVFLGLLSHAQLIPVQRSTAWNHSGYPDSIPDPALIADVSAFGAIGDGIANDYPAVLSAINSLGGLQGVVYFPPGTYKIGSSLHLPDSVILRGAGADSTHLLFNLAGSVTNCINISGGPAFVSVSVLAGEIGSDSLDISDVSGITSGNVIELMQNNGSWDTQPVFWADNSVGQILKITGVDSVNNRLYLASPLRFSVDTALQARVRLLQPARQVGLECLKISRADNVSSGVCYNINYYYAIDCWMKGVESAISIGSHIMLDASSNISISGCYIHHAYAYDGSSTHGYGITLFNHAGECRIENNILRFLRHAFSFQAGANGNVIAYNYSIEPNRSEAPANFGADISFHGHYPFMNLIEGNIVQNIQIDQTWGPSGPYNTFFRNRVELYGIIMTSATVESDAQHFIGNEVNNTDLFMGNYILAGTNHIEYGNMVRGNLTPAGTAPLNDSSYYLMQAPAFWHASLPWPSLGIPNSPGSESIPAKNRYLSGQNLTVCGNEILTAVPTLPDQDMRITIFPNPAKQQVYLKVSSSKNQKLNLLLYDTKGSLLYKNEQIVRNGINIISLDHPGTLVPGMYFLQVKTNSSNKFLKLLVE